MRILMFISWAGAALAIVGVLMTNVFGWAIPLTYWMAAFLGCFGLAKGLVGVTQLQALAQVAHGGPDPRAGFANPFLFKCFLAFKFATWAMAWTAAVVLLNVHPHTAN